MRVKKSYLVAGSMVALVAGYFVLSAVFGGDKHAEAAPTKKADEIALVRVSAIAPAVRPDVVRARGRTEAARSVIVRSETSGVVAATPAVEGGFVRAGQVLCRLDVDARQATLDQARARLRSEQLQFEAGQRLQEQGFRSETQVLAAKAELDGAAAAVRQAEVALDQINIRAPFSGVFDNREAEVGSYLGPGQACGSLLELDPLLLVADVTEAEAGRVRVGEAASARLSDGRVITGRVRYVSREAHPQTRTYRVEVQARNPGFQILSGLSAELSVEAGRTEAHLVPVTALVLDSAGRQGVRHVGAGDQVLFTPVTVLEETPQGVWVSGLSGTPRLITVGQSYVAEGQKVRVAAR